MTDKAETYGKIKVNTTKKTK